MLEGHAKGRSDENCHLSVLLAAALELWLLLQLNPLLRVPYVRMHFRPSDQASWVVACHEARFSGRTYPRTWLTLPVIPSAMLLLTAALSTAIARPAVPSARPQITRATATASGATATAPSWQLASTLSTIDALERTGGTRPHSLLTGLVK